MARPPQILLGDPNELIVTSFGGKIFKGSRRTFAHLWETQRLLTIFRASAVIRVIQPCYNDDVSASAGTHDFDAVLDIEIIGWDDWYAESDFLRACGWADWVRDPSQGFPWHHHMASRGTPEFFDDGRRRLGEFVPGQLDDFNRHALGLVGGHNTGADPQCRDSSGRIVHSLAPMFNYTTWMKDYKMDKADRDWLKAQLAAMEGRIVEQAAARAAQLVMADTVDTIEGGPEKGKKVTTKIALRQSSRGHREVL